jgi:hypothetical protein
MWYVSLIASTPESDGTINRVPIVTVRSGSLWLAQIALVEGVRDWETEIGKFRHLCPIVDRRDYEARLKL